MDIVTKWRIKRLIKKIPYRFMDVPAVLIGCIFSLVILSLFFIGSVYVYHVHTLYNWFGETAWTK